MKKCIDSHVLAVSTSWRRVQVHVPATGIGFFRVPTASSFHRLLQTHYHNLILGWYNRPNSSRHTKLPQCHPTQRKTCIKIFILWHIANNIFPLWPIVHLLAVNWFSNNIWSVQSEVIWAFLLKVSFAKTYSLCCNGQFWNTYHTCERLRSCWVTVVLRCRKIKSGIIYKLPELQWWSWYVQITLICASGHW